MKVLKSNDVGKTFEETSPPLLCEGGRASAGQHLVARAGAGTARSGRRRAGVLVSQPDGANSWEMVPGISNHEHAQQVAARSGRPVPAHDPPRRRARAHRHLDRRALPERGRRKDVRGVQQGIGVGFAPDAFPEWGQCVHKIAGHPKAAGEVLHPEPRRLSRSPGDRRRAPATTRNTPGGRSRRGCPSDFGFPIVVHPHDPDTVYVVPLEPMSRTCPAAKPAVWQSENAGSRGRGSSRVSQGEDVLHRSLRDANGHRRPEGAGALLGTTTGSALDRQGRRREVEVPVRGGCRR